MTPGNGESLTVDCHVRTDALSGPVEPILSTLEELLDDGAIDDVSLRSWPRRVELADATDQSTVVERFRTFEQWAEHHDVSIEPPFAVETRTSRITDERREVLITPVCCVAISVDGTLRTVAPHHGDATTYTVEDALSALTRHGEAGMRVSP